MNSPDPDQRDTADMVRLLAGHEAALNELMERHAERLFHYLVRSLQNEEDAAELAQETFVKVYHNRARFDQTKKFSTWLYAIASNLVRDRYRWRARHPQIALEAVDEQTGHDFRETVRENRLNPGEAAVAQERAELVRKAVAELPEDLRLPLILAEYEDQSQAEIAAILGCTTKAVEMRVYRARQQLREALAGVLS